MDSSEADVPLDAGMLRSVADRIAAAAGLSPASDEELASTRERLAERQVLGAAQDGIVSPREAAEVIFAHIATAVARANNYTEAVSVSYSRTEAVLLKELEAFVLTVLSRTRPPPLPSRR